MSKLFGAVAKLSIFSLCLLPPSLCERSNPSTANSADVYASVQRGVDGAVRQIVLSHPTCHSRLRSVFHADDTGVSVAHRARHVPTFVLASLCVGDGLSATGYAASAGRLAASAQLATTAAFNRTTGGVNALLLDLRARVVAGTSSHMTLDAMGHMLGVLSVRMLADNGSGLREWLASPFVRALGVNVSMGAPRHRDRVRYNVDRSQLIADGSASVLVNVWNALAPDASSPAAHSLTEHPLSAMLGLCSPPPALVFVLRCETLSSRHVDYVINCAESLLRHAAVCPPLRMPVVVATGRDAATVHYVDAVAGGGKAFGGLLALLTHCPTGGRLSDALLQVATGLHVGSSLLVVYEPKVLIAPVDSAETLSLLDAIVRHRSLTVDSIMLGAAGDLRAFPVDVHAALADEAAVWQLSARSLGIALAAGDAAELALATTALRTTAVRHNRVLLANAVFRKAAHRRGVSLTVSPSCHTAVTVIVRTAGRTELAELLALAPQVTMDCDSAGRLHVCTVERFSQPFAISVHSADESVHVQVFASATDAYVEVLPQLVNGRVWESTGFDCSVTFTSLFTGSNQRRMHCADVKPSNATEFVAYQTTMADGAVESIIGSSLSLAAPKAANAIGVKWLVNGKRRGAIAPSTEITALQFAMGQGHGAPPAVTKSHRAVYMYTLCGKNASGAPAQPVVTSTLAHITDYVTVPTCHGAYGHTACVTVVSTLNGSSNVGGSLMAPRSACADLHTAGALAAVDVTVPGIELTYGSGSSPREQCTELDTYELCEQSWSASVRTRHAGTLMVLTDPADAVTNVSLARTATSGGASNDGSVWLMQANCCMRSLSVLARSTALSRLTAALELSVVTDWYSLADKRAKARLVKHLAWVFAAVFIIMILCALLFGLFRLGKRYKQRHSAESPRKYDVRKSKERLMAPRDALKTTQL